MKLMLCLVAGAVFSVVHAQEKHKRIQVGDTLGNGLVLGTMMEDSTKVVRLSDYAGKLIILDFWSSNCPSCIAGFPKLEKLQQEFAEEIQILLVNTSETAFEISEKLEKEQHGNRHGRLSEVFLETRLPKIIGTDRLSQLFYHRSVPYHVWVDSSGVVRVFGASYNTNGKKINALLSGDPIDFIHTSSSGYPYDFSVPWFFDRDGDGGRASHASAISFFDFSVYGFGAYRENLDDGASQGIRSTYINVDILRLFKLCLEDRMLANGWSSLLSSPNMNGYAWHLDFIKLLVADTTIYTRDFLASDDWTDESFSRNGRCYELILSGNMTEIDRQEWMFADISRYVTAAYGVTVEYVWEDVVGYEVKLTGADLCRELQGENSLHDQLASVFWRFFRTNREQKRPYIFLDEQLRGKSSVGLHLDKVDGTFEDFESELSTYGIRLVPVIKRLPFLSIADR